MGEVVDRDCTVGEVVGRVSLVGQGFGRVAGAVSYGMGFIGWQGLSRRAGVGREAGDNDSWGGGWQGGGGGSGSSRRRQGGHYGAHVPACQHCSSGGRQGRWRGNEVEGRTGHLMGLGRGNPYSLVVT